MVAHSVVVVVVPCFPRASTPLPRSLCPSTRKIRVRWSSTVDPFEWWCTLEETGDGPSHLFTHAYPRSITYSLTRSLSHSLAHSSITIHNSSLSSGQGRTLAGEDLLVRRLNEAGAAATKCCDYATTSFEEQITLAYQADVVMGIHGAALTHAVFGPRGKYLHLSIQSIIHSKFFLS